MELHMNKNSMAMTFISILITYIVKKIGFKLVGFHYDIFSEGILNIKFLIDVISWVVIYAIVNFLFKKLSPNRTS
jgi:hypothetical protein